MSARSSRAIIAICAAVLLAFLGLCLVGSSSSGLPAHAQTCVPTGPPPRQISSGQTLSGYICPATQQDLYYFDGNQGDQVVITMAASVSTDGSLFPSLELYTCCDASGHMVANAAGPAATATLSYTLPSSGRYAIRAGSLQGNSTGPYTITLVDTPASSGNGGGSGQGCTATNGYGCPPPRPVCLDGSFPGPGNTCPPGGGGNSGQNGGQQGGTKTCSNGVQIPSGLSCGDAPTPGPDCPGTNVPIQIGQACPPPSNSNNGNPPFYCISGPNSTCNGASTPTPSPQPPRAPQPSSRKVIYVAGINSGFNCSQVDFPSTSQWWTLWSRLQQDDSALHPDDLYVFDYNGSWNCVSGVAQSRANYSPLDTCGNIGGPDGYSAVFGQWFDGLVQSNPQVTFDIIAHSMGGLVVGEWLSQASQVQDDALSRVHSVITLDSPLQGRSQADFLVNAAHAWPNGFACSATSGAVTDIDPDSLVVSDVNYPNSPSTDCTDDIPPANITQLGFHFVTIGNQDDLVVPGGGGVFYNLSCIPGATTNLSIVDACGDTLNHACVFSNKDAVKAIYDTLIEP